MAEQREWEEDAPKDGFNSIEAFLNEIDERCAARCRTRMGFERRLVSWTRVGSERWRACVSHQKIPRLRFVREGKTRVRAIENSDKALNDLLKLLRSRGTAPPGSRPMQP